MHQLDIEKKLQEVYTAKMLLRYGSSMAIVWKWYVGWQQRSTSRIQEAEMRCIEQLKVVIGEISW